MYVNPCFWLVLAAITVRNLSELCIKLPDQSRRTAGTTGRYSLFLLVAGHGISGTAILLYLYFDGGCGVAGMVMGLILLLAGFYGRVVGIRKMGASYHRMIIIPAGGLVTDGIYSLVRHPLYFFYTLEMVGLFMVRPNSFSLCTLFLVISAILWRIRAEDPLLAKTYGAEFEAYRRRTKSFIPYVL